MELFPPFPSSLRLVPARKTDISRSVSARAVSMPLLPAQGRAGAQPATAERGGLPLSQPARAFRAVRRSLLLERIAHCGSFVHASVCVCVSVCVLILPRLAHFNAAFSPDENIHILIKEKKCAKYKFASVIISGS